MTAKQAAGCVRQWEQRALHSLQELYWRPAGRLSLWLIGSIIGLTLGLTLHLLMS